MRNGIYIFLFVFSAITHAQNFEHIKDFEDVLVETDKYNMSSVVEGQDAFYFAHRVGTDYFFANRFQFSKTDTEGNTIFHKEVLAPTGVEFNWGFNHATPPPMTFAENRISIVLAAYLETTPYTPFFYQFIFDTNGNIIQQNTFDSPIYQEFSNVEATTDGFVFISTEASVNTAENPAALHLFKSDFNGNMLWQRQYQLTDQYDNTMYAKALTFDASGNIYVAVFQFPLSTEETQATALFKFDSNGEFIFVKRYIDEGNFTGAIRNICLAFNTHNLNEELYIMSSWDSVLNTNRTNIFKLNTDGEVLESIQLFDVEFGSALTTSISESGCTALIGKESSDGITNSFENSGDPILINFNTDLTINWAYAYGGEDFHYTDDMIDTKDGSYLILARSDEGDYLIKTDANGASVCETVTPTIAPSPLTITVADKEAYEMDYPMDLIDIASAEIIDIPFYEAEDRCCPGGVPVVEFEYSYSTETGLVNFTNTTNNGDDFNWNFDDGSFSADSDPEHEYLSNGTYEVCLTAENECGTAFYCQEIILESIGVNDWENQKIHITSNETGIQVNTPLNVDIQLYNSIGQIYYRNTSTSSTTAIKKPIPGIYFCKITQAGKLIYSEKIIFQ